MAHQSPTAGQTVMFQSGYTNREYPAIVERVNADGSLHLAVFDTDQNPPCVAQKYIRYSETKDGTSWHWPEIMKSNHDKVREIPKKELQ